MREISIGVHELIGRKVWSKDPAALAEAKNEATIAIGKLMTIMSWKNAESESDGKLKARIVFLGNDVRDEFGLASEFQTIKVIPTTIAGLNINLAYGKRRGNKSTQSDVTKAYVQSGSDTLHPTFVELPRELCPDHLKGIDRPCARLKRSLYGHPESGGHWGRKFVQIMKDLGGHELKLFPSNFLIPKWGLLVMLYVDDIVISGPEQNHCEFWDACGKRLTFDTPKDVGKVLGRTHILKDNEIIFDMSDFAEVTCKLYEEECRGLGFPGFKKVPTPYLEESTLPEDDWVAQGQSKAAVLD